MNAPRANADDRPPQCMRAMMRRLGVDTLELMYAGQGAIYQACCIACRTCENVSDCVDWLEDAPEETAAPEFCPNREALARFKTP